MHSDAEQKSSSHTKLRDSRQNPTKAEAESADFRIHALMRRSSPPFSVPMRRGPVTAPLMSDRRRDPSANPSTSSLGVIKWGQSGIKASPSIPTLWTLVPGLMRVRDFFSRSKLHASLRSRERTSATVGDEGPANTGWIMEHKYVVQHDLGKHPRHRRGPARKPAESRPLPGLQSVL